MANDLVLGIDLGTTNSVVAVADGAQCRVLTTELGHRLVPSVVSFAPGRVDPRSASPPKLRIIVGEEARERRLVDAANTVYSIKRLIGRPFSAPEVRRAQERFAFELVKSKTGSLVVKVHDTTYTLTEISAFVLRELRRVAEHQLEQQCRRAVITVPANFNELQRSATKAAGRVAGLEVERIINEPTAAALAYGYGKDRAEKVAVFDLGGGTFDLTLLELEDDVFEVLATAGDSFLGGDDIDLLVAELMAERFLAQHGWDVRTDKQSFERMRAAAEWAKCQLTSHPAAELTIEGLGEQGRPVDFETTITRGEFEDAIRPTLATAFDVCQQAFEEIGAKPTDLDNVVLVGGSTRIPLVRQMVEQYFDAKPRVEFDPDLVVAQGAAIHGYALSGIKKPTAALGKVGLKRVSAKELARLKSERKKRKAKLPKQPAFAPSPIVAVGGAPATKARPTPPPPPLPSLPEPRPPSIPPGQLELDSEIPAPSSPKPLELDPHGLPGVVGESSVLEDLDLDDLESVRPMAPPKPAQPPPPPAGRSKPSQTGLVMPGVVTAATQKVGEPLAPLPPPSGLAPLPPPGEPTGLGDEFDFGLAPDELPFPDDLPGELEGRSTLEPDGFGAEPAAPAEEPTAGLAFAMPERAMPILMDVTPHSLGVEMAGGYCQKLIHRNAPIPTEQSQTFTTARDGQGAVRVRVCQGEQQLFAGNEPLGEVELSGLREAARGAVKINVTFMLDASGTLSVSAVDEDTGVRQAIQINLLGGADDDAIAAMAARQDELVGS